MFALRIIITLVVVAAIYLFRLALFAAGCVVYLYLLPGVLAQKKNHPRYRRIYLLCALSGWLLIPWLAALLWVAVAPPILNESKPELELEW